MPPGIGGRASRRGGKTAIWNGWSKFEPPIFFSLAREKKTGRSRSKRKERLKGAVQDFGWYFYKREVQIDLPLRRTPLPLLRWSERLVYVPSTTGSSDSGKRSRSNQ